MHKSSKGWMRRAGWSVFVLAGVLSIAGCKAELKSQMKEQEQGLKGTGAPGVSAGANRPDAPEKP